MSFPDHARDGWAGVRRLGADTDFRAFRAARERYLAQLRADTETRLLETAWRSDPAYARPLAGPADAKTPRTEPNQRSPR